MERDVLMPTERSRIAHYERAIAERDTRIHALEAELAHSNELIAEILDGSKIEKAALEAVLAGVCARLDILQMREAAYRSAHDLHGDGSMKSGAAWDAMRHAGDAARAILHRREVDASPETTPDAQMETG